MIQISLTCPIGDCHVTHTYDYDEDIKNYPGSIKEVKGRVREMVVREHENGKHKLYLEQAAKMKAERGNQDGQ